MKKVFSIFSMCFSALLTWPCKILGIAVLPFDTEYLGLGNRLKGIANFHARGYRRFLIIWNEHQWVTDRFENLFALNDSSIFCLSSGFWYRLLRIFFRRFIPVGVVCPETPFWSFILPDELVGLAPSHKYSFCKNIGYSVDFMFNRTPRQIMDYYLPFFLSLLPSKKVLARAERLSLPEHVIGIQIRNTGEKGDAKVVTSIESIFDVLDRYPSGTLFFMSAMRDNVAQRFRKRYGHRILELPGKDYSSMIDSVADMWLLAHCETLIAANNSTFSELAWWWGGGRGSVIMLNGEYNQAYA